MTPLTDRFWAKVDKRGADECWLWLWFRNRKGYGRVRSGGKSRAMLLVHRVSWEVANGPIPDGICVCHRCDVPACVNPAHLFLGTQADNVADMLAKGRGGYKAPRGERNGRAKLTDAQVREIRASEGSQMAIAARFGIGEATVSKIRNGKRWSHVQ